MKKQPELTDGDFEALAAFRHELRRYLAFAQEVAEATGITMQQHQALLAVHASKERALSITELADTMFLRHHSAVELTDRLEKAELAERVRDPTDGRRMLVKLAPRGAELLNSLAVRHLQEIREHGPRLARTLSRVIQR
jgi:DNA-binding MarR family transcriptional regulator